MTDLGLWVFGKYWSSHKLPREYPSETGSAYGRPGFKSSSQFQQRLLLLKVAIVHAKKARIDGI